MASNAHPSRGRGSQTAEDLESRPRGDRGDTAQRGDIADRGPSAGEPIRRDFEPHGTDARTGFLPTLKRTFTEFSEDNLSDWAAALTYYGLLALFPALIAMVSIVGLVGDPQTITRTVTDIVTSIGPKSSADTFKGPIESVTSNKGGAGILAIVGIVGALWSASGYVGAFMRASNIIYETPEGRPIWKLRPLQMAVTLLLLVLTILVVLSMALTGSVADAVADATGISSSVVDVFKIAKWPIMIALVLTIFAILYYTTPNVKLRRFTFVSPGALFALVVWVVASALFAFYLSKFASYNKTYGSLGGVIAALTWLYITNAALLLGQQLNAERERSKEIDEGTPRAEKEIQLEARDDPKRQKTT